MLGDYDIVWVPKEQQTSLWKVPEPLPSIIYDWHYRQKLFAIPMEEQSI
jgi:hypothetical protein